MKGDHDFRAMGREHALAGMPRYKFQDSHLQKLYDQGYELLEDEVPTKVVRCLNCGFRYYLEPGTRVCPNCGNRHKY